MKHIIERLLADTPTFFKKLQVLGGSLAGLGVTLSSVQGIPANIVGIASHLIWVGGTIVAVAQFAMKNTPDEKK
jgi:hypothetical protein